MWPGGSERRSPRVCDFLTHWILDQRDVGVLLLDAHHNGPSTLRRVLQMFYQRIVVLLPSIHSCVAKEAFRVVRIGFVRIVIKPGLRHLYNNHPVN